MCKLSSYLEIPCTPSLTSQIEVERGFYVDKLNELGIETIVPEKADRETVSNIIYDELVTGKILKESRNKYMDISNKLIEQQNIEGLVLGCTEIPLLIKPKDVKIPVFNTTEIYANEAVNFATT